MERGNFDSLLAPIFARQKSRGKIHVVSGPSGAGKTVVCHAVQKRIANLVYSISYTTRPKRSQEIDGSDYFFVSTETFDTMIQKGQFLEWARVHGNFYGTSMEKIHRQIDSGNSVILDIDVNGARQIREKEKYCTSIFLLPPSQEILHKRLVERRSDSPEEINKRIEKAYHEIENYRQYDYIVVNEDFDKLVNQLEGIIRAESFRIV